MSIENLSPARRKYLDYRTRRVLDIIPLTLDSMKTLYYQSMSLVWDQEADVGPAEVLENAGTEAAELFSGGASLLNFILQHDPDWDNYPVPTHEFTINPDGTVTLGALLNPPPPSEPMEE